MLPSRGPAARRAPSPSRLRRWAEHDLLVNGTSLGMRPQDAAPFDLTALHAGQFVAEAIMDPETTPLLAAALAAGCRIQRGLPMLECQIALMARHMGAL